MPSQTPGYPGSCRGLGVWHTRWYTEGDGAEGSPNVCQGTLVLLYTLESKGSVIKPIWEAQNSFPYSFTIHTTRSKALRSPAEKKPLSQMYLITELFFSVTHTNIPQRWGLLQRVVSAPYNSVSHGMPSSMFSCLLSFLPSRLSAPGGQSPSFPVSSRDPLHVADPRAGAPRYPATDGWQR